MQQPPKDILKDDHDFPHNANVTKEKINRHLSDKHDTISEEDLQNINTDMNAPNDEIEKEEMKTGKEKSKENNERPKKEMPNTWDILDETDE